MSLTPPGWTSIERRWPRPIRRTSIASSPNSPTSIATAIPISYFFEDSHTSQLFWNNGNGTFTDGTIAAGLGTDKSGMGSALGDFNNDGKMDWFVSAIFDTPFVGVNPGNRLYRNNGNRTFTDVTTAAGVRNSGSGEELSWGWGTTFFDYDNDTHQDLIMTEWLGRSRLWR